MAMTKREKMDLEVAQMKRREAEEKISVLFGNEPTNTFTIVGIKEYPLLPNANIKFVLPGQGNTIQARIREGKLEIEGNSWIEILPEAANAIKIQTKIRRDNGYIC